MSRRWDRPYSTPPDANNLRSFCRANHNSAIRCRVTKPRSAAAQLNYRDIHIPPQYLSGVAQLARNLKREAEMAAALRV